MVDKYALILTDKYGNELKYFYLVRDEDKVDNLMLLLEKKCINAKLGYSYETDAYVKKNKINLPKG